MQTRRGLPGRGLGLEVMSERRPMFIVRPAASGWPGSAFSQILGDQFIVTLSEALLPDVVLLDGVSAAAVAEIRRRHQGVGIVVHTTTIRTAEMLDAGADVVVGLEPLVEVAARVQALVRRLPSGRCAP